MQKYVLTADGFECEKLLVLAGNFVVNNVTQFCAKV